MRVSRRDVGVSVGKAVFHSHATSRGIQKALRAVPTEKLNEALQKHGLGHATPKEIASVLSGKDRAGWSQKDLKRAVEVFRTVGIAPEKKTAYHVVSESMKNAMDLAAQQANGTPLLSKAELKKRTLQQWRQERTEEEGHEQRLASGEESLGVKERARFGAAQIGGAGASLTADPVHAELANKGGTVRQLRETLRKELGLSAKKFSSPIPPPPGPSPS